MLMPSGGHYCRNYGGYHVPNQPIVICDGLLTAKINLLKKTVEDWASYQGHDRCWYYPEIFEQIAQILGIDLTKFDRKLPSETEFRCGCERYRKEQYGNN